jgi:hypothetical protein
MCAALHQQWWQVQHIWSLLRVCHGKCWHLSSWCPRKKCHAHASAAPAPGNAPVKSVHYPQRPLCQDDVEHSVLPMNPPGCWQSFWRSAPGLSLSRQWLIPGSQLCSHVVDGGIELRNLLNQVLLGGLRVLRATGALRSSGWFQEHTQVASSMPGLWSGDRNTRAAADCPHPLLGK